MIHISALLPAFVIVFALAGTSLATANGSNTNNATQDHAKTAQAADSCGSAPRYLEPAYCGPNHRH
jgi:hypothetical protein